MKRDTAPKINTPVSEEVEVEANEPKKRPKAQPVKAKKATVYRVKCVWSGPVKVAADKTPSGTAYEFQPSQEQDITSKQDAVFLASLERGAPGCCGSSGQPQRYFELV